MIQKIQKIIKSDKNLELLKGGSISFIFQILGIGLSYLFILLISRYYGAEGMGIYALSFTVLNIVVLFGKFGLDVSCIKFVGELSEKKEYSKIKGIYLNILILAFPINILLTFILFYLAPYLSEFVFNKVNLTIYFQLIAFAILPMSFRFIHANSIRGMRNIKVYSFIQNISMYLFSLIFLLLFIVLGNSQYSEILISVLIGSTFGLVLSTFFWLKESKFLQNTYVSSLNLKQILSISTPLLLASSIMLVVSFTDTIMLGIFKTEADVGIYNVVYKIATVGMIIFMAMNTISTPKIASAYSNREVLKLKEIVLQTTKIIFIFTFPFSLIIIIFRVEILSLFGENFTEGSLSLIFLTIGFFIKSILGTSESILQMSNQQKILIYYSSFVAILNILLNYLLIPVYGIDGASFASMFSIIIYQILVKLKANKEFGSTLLFGKINA